jgi:hypothetical protein
LISNMIDMIGLSKGHWALVAVQITMRMEEEVQGQHKFPKDFAYFKQFVIRLEASMGNKAWGLDTGGEPPNGTMSGTTSVNLADTDLRHSLNKKKWKRTAKTDKWCDDCGIMCDHTTETHWHGPGPPPSRKYQGKKGNKGGEDKLSKMKEMRLKKQEREKFKKKKETRKCFICNKKGHLARDCPDKTDKSGKGRRRDNGDDASYMVELYPVEGNDYSDLNNFDMTAFLVVMEDEDGPLPLVIPDTTSSSSSEDKGGSLHPRGGAGIASKDFDSSQDENEVGTAGQAFPNELSFSFILESATMA